MIRYDRLVGNTAEGQELEFRWNSAKTPNDKLRNFLPNYLHFFLITELQQMLLHMTVQILLMHYSTDFRREVKKRRIYNLIRN